MRDDKKNNIVKFSMVVLIIILLFAVGFIISNSKNNKLSRGIDSNDECTTNAIEMWDQYGCSVLYEENGDEAELFWGSVLKDNEVFESIKADTTFLHFFCKYSDDEIYAALNAIVFGCNDPCHESGDYTSIRDIPTELRISCLNQLNIRNTSDFLFIQNAFAEFVSKIKCETSSR